MHTFTTDQVGRIVLIHLGKGECILESIQKEMKRLNIENGILVSAIGSLRKAVLHYIASTQDQAENKFITIEKPIELAGAQGLIIQGEPHFHLTVSDSDRVYTGHMESGCEVQYLAELAILELPEVSITRKNDEFGISYIDSKE